MKRVFSDDDREKKGVLKASPHTAYKRVCSFFEKLGVDEKIVPFSTFKDDLENGAVRRAAALINTIDERLDHFIGVLETLEELANRMLGPRLTMTFDMDGPKVRSEDNGSPGWDALSTAEKNALIILFATLRARKSVLLIDDVESSLDPGVQKELTKNMRELNPEGQFILTTRNGVMMDYAYKGCCFWLEKGGVVRTG